jgi:hypothetical protein
LHEAHWSALCREPMTCDFVGFFVQSVSLSVVSTLTTGDGKAGRQGRGRFRVANVAVGKYLQTVLPLK